MILGIAFEPFTQQALGFPIVPQTLSSNATVPIATNYAATEFNEASTDGIDGTADAGTDVELSMKAAIYDGLFYSNISQTGASISVNCATGNCTFATYGTLSVCSQCENVTSLISTSPDWNTDRGNMTLPNGLLLNASHASFATSTKMLSTTKLSAVQQVLTNLSVIGDMSFGQGVAYECIVYLCGEVYRGDVSDGAFTETVDYSVGSSKPYAPPWETSTLDPSVSITIPGKKLPSSKNMSLEVMGPTNDALKSFLQNGLTGNVTGYTIAGGTGANPSSDSYTSSLPTGNRRQRHSTGYGEHGQGHEQSYASFFWANNFWHRLQVRDYNPYPLAMADFAFCPRASLDIGACPDDWDQQTSWSPSLESFGTCANVPRGPEVA